MDLSWVEPDGASDPLAISLLLDQGASLAVTDPEDRRLLGAKYFQTQLDTDDQVLLAAFAADNASTGDAALLPSQPVTIFPVANPAFTTDGAPTSRRSTRWRPSRAADRRCMPRSVK